MWLRYCQHSEHAVVGDDKKNTETPTISQLYTSILMICESFEYTNSARLFFFANQTLTLWFQFRVRTTDNVSRWKLEFSSYAEITILCEVFCFCWLERKKKHMGNMKHDTQLFFLHIWYCVLTIKNKFVEKTRRNWSSWKSRELYRHDEPPQLMWNKRAASTDNLFQGNHK